MEESNLDFLAKSTGAIKRKRLFNGKKLLDLLLFSTDFSLRDSATKFQENHHTTISHQGIDKHYNRSSLEFLKCLLNDLLASQLSSLPTNVDEIIIKDSTKFQLPDSMKESFPGPNGAGVDAMVNIQFEFGIQSRSGALKVVEGRHSDQYESIQDKETIRKGCLYLRDLGYATIDYMKNIEKNEGFFINKVSSSVDIYIKDNKSFKLLDLSIIKDARDIEAYLGAQKYPVRLLVEPMPEAIKEKRLLKRNKHNKKKKGTTSNRFIERSGFNFLVTNLTDKDAVSLSLIQHLYKLRWQIELVFKSWKSVLKIDETKNVNTMRASCILYARIIIAILCWKISMGLGRIGKISIIKVARQVMNSLDKFREMLLERNMEWIELIKRIRPQYLIREQRRRRINVNQVIEKYEKRKSCTTFDTSHK